MSSPVPEDTLLLQLARLARKAVDQRHMSVPTPRSMLSNSTVAIPTRRTFIERVYKGYERVWCVETVGSMLNVYRSERSYHGEVSCDPDAMFVERDGNITRLFHFDLTDCRRLHKRLRDMFLLDVIADAC